MDRTLDSRAGGHGNLIMYGPWMTTMLENGLFLRLFYALSNITMHLYPAFAYYHKFHTMLSIAACINASCEKDVL